MNQQPTTNPAEPVVKATKKLSLVWFIPVLALVLGIWLVYRHQQDQGPEIEISFTDAAGIAVDKTKIKFRDVELGHITQVRLSDDLSGVIVRAQMAKETAPYLNENAKFWIVKPRVGTEGVSGLNTLLSGAYIGMDSSTGNAEQREFVGLNTPPPRSQSAAGVRISMQSDNAFSLGEGSPIYYRQFAVGEIDSIKLDEDFSTIRIEGFIEAPYDQLVSSDTFFWNVSGVRAEISAEGVSLELQSIESLLLGGIAFDTHQSTINAQTDASNAQDVVYRLYENREAVDAISYTNKEYYVLNFDQSIRGLNIGAPVSFKGLDVGKVTRIDTHRDEAEENFSIPITIEVEPERLGIESETLSEEQARAEFEELVASGFRAKLQIGNLLTGQLFVTLDFYEDADPVEATYFLDVPEIPTISTDLEKITHNIGEVVAKINDLELKPLIENFNQAILRTRLLIANTDGKLGATLNSLEETLTDARGLIDSADGKLVSVLDSLNTTLSNSQTLIAGMDEGSATRYQLDELMKEMQQAARSVRRLTESIEKNPNSLIFGKQSGTDNQ